MDSTGDLKHAILHTLAYSDVFDYPLRLDEIHRYLPVRATLNDLPLALNDLADRVHQQNGYYHLLGRAEIVLLRKEREKRSRPVFEVALRYGRVLGALPFVRMAALTGSLAMLNISKTADLDYMLVAAHGRVWTARAFALAFGRITRLQGHVICPNLIVSERALEWPLHDLYSAHELCQMIPIAGMDVYHRLREANRWANAFLPNAAGAPQETLADDNRKILFPEIPLRGRIGNGIEQWEMKRKVERLSRQDGFGEETVFNANVCQGNFHHHRKWTHEVFRSKLESLGVEK